jgi:hypothetical protein
LFSTQDNHSSKLKEIFAGWNSYFSKLDHDGCVFRREREGVRDYPNCRVSYFRSGDNFVAEKTDIKTGKVLWVDGVNQQYCFSLREREHGSELFIESVTTREENPKFGEIISAPVLRGFTDWATEGFVRAPLLGDFAEFEKMGDAFVVTNLVEGTDTIRVDFTYDHNKLPPGKDESFRDGWMILQQGDFFCRSKCTCIFNIRLFPKLNWRR